MKNKVFIVALPQEVNLTKSINGFPIIYSGVGKINASIAALSAIHQGYDEIINIGSCGSVNLKTGTIVKIGQVFQDIDGTPLSKYGETPFEAASEQIVLDRTTLISCFTTDYFYDSKQIDKYSPSYLSMINRSSVFDMECFAIAKVCKRFNIPFSSYKWVSDDGDNNSWEENCKIGFESIKGLLY
jgi:adenosylhomocysteine nucleosidase